MKFLLSVIAVCLVMITAKLYIPMVNAEECKEGVAGYFKEDEQKITKTYILCADVIATTPLITTPKERLRKHEEETRINYSNVDMGEFIDTDRAKDFELAITKLIRKNIIMYGLGEGDVISLINEHTRTKLYEYTRTNSPTKQKTLSQKEILKLVDENCSVNNRAGLTTNRIYSHSHSISCEYD